MVCLVHGAGSDITSGVRILHPDRADHTHVQADIVDVQHRALMADQTMSPGTVTFTMDPVTVEAGGVYAYEFAPAGRSLAGASSTARLGSFAGTAVPAAHFRGVFRVLNTTYASDAINVADLTSECAAYQVNNALTTLMVLRGTFVCATGGTLTPRATIATYDTVWRQGSTFTLRRVG